MWIKRILKILAFAGSAALVVALTIGVMKGTLPFLSVRSTDDVQETEETAAPAPETEAPESETLGLDEILGLETVIPVKQDGTDEKTEEYAIEKLSDLGLEFLSSNRVHDAYINGYDDGTVRPDGQITRAEAAQIIYNLLRERPAVRALLADVEMESWYYDAVGLLAAYGVIGVENDRARPEELMTRGEFVSAIVLFFPDYVSMKSDFSDVPASDPLYRAVSKAHYLGIVSGYPDGTFRPGATITRAEVMKVMNRALSRMPDREAVDKQAAEQGERFADLTREHWAYYEIMEATIGHTYEVKGSRESWNSSVAYAANPESDDGTGTADEPGSDESPADGAPADGAPADEPPTDVPATGEPSAPVEEPPAEQNLYTPGPVFIGDDLYWADENGSLITDRAVGHLWFGSDGRYTTGDSAVDGYVKDIIARITTSEMTQEQKLYTCFVHVRDGYEYRRLNFYDQGAKGWEVAEGKTMFETGKGNCYCYAAAFALLARQLGYDADAISGLVGVDYQQHGWVEIVFDGETYIFDTILESSYRARGYDYNFYLMSYSAAPWPYVK
ncbi:MAG: S-layer homology domain-containing protein [Clostridia bacterium]|nr:S-layer homology domain-containing protein [Clostridia bacterium]